MIVLHSTRGGQVEGVEAQATINWFMNPESAASAHLLITRNGEIIRFVDDYDQAWASGQYLNMRSLQVEMEQPDNDTPFTDAQMASVATAVRYWMQKHNIAIDHVVGHDQTEQGQAYGKSDPGKMFDWGVLWPQVNA